MDLWTAFILGIVQGLTEFLPVSSSGHLVLVQKLVALPGNYLFFDIIVHAGTLIAVLVYLRRELAGIARAACSRAWLEPLGSFRSDPDFRRLLLVLLATIPTGLMGLLFKDWCLTLFNSIEAVGWALLATGVILMTTRWVARSTPLDRPGPANALVMGIAQGLAVIPGVSRSGSTIAAGLLTGLRREEAARFSFLMAVPAILGAVLLESLGGGANEIGAGPLIVGFIIAGLTGYAALAILVKVLNSGRFHWFAYYCWAVGGLILFGGG